MKPKKAKRKPEYDNLSIPCRRGDPLSTKTKRAVKYIMISQGFTSVAQALRFAAMRTEASIKGVS